MDLWDQKKVNVTLTSDAQKFVADAKIDLVFSVRNSSSQSKLICRYMTPFEGFYGNILEVKNEAGELIPYVGIKKKRKKPGKDDYFKLKEGEKKIVRFNLRKNYPFAASGMYFVRFKGSQFLNRLPDSEILKLVVE